MTITQTGPENTQGWGSERQIGGQGGGGGQELRVLWAYKVDEQT